MSIEKDVLLTNSVLGSLQGLQGGTTTNEWPLQPTPCACKQWLNDFTWSNAAVSFHCATHGQVTIDRRLPNGISLTLPSNLPWYVAPTMPTTGPYTVPYPFYPNGQMWIGSTQVGHNMGKVDGHDNVQEPVCQADGYDSSTNKLWDPFND